MGSQSSVNLYKVDPSLSGAVIAQPAVSELLFQLIALWRGKQTAQSIIDKVGSGAMQLWVLSDSQAAIFAIVLTEIIRYPERQCLRIVGVAGRERTLWMHHLAGIEDYARQVGCTGIELIGRKGWEKVLKDYELTGIMLERDLP